MKYWSSGEVESSVGDSFRLAMNILEEKICLLLSSKNYTKEIDSLDVIYIISKEGGLDKICFKSKSKTLDLRIVINFEIFLNSSAEEQKLILLDGLVKSLTNVQKNKNIKYFDIFEFTNDLKKILINE